MHFKELTRYLRKAGHQLAICDSERVSSEFAFFSYSLFDLVKLVLWSDCIYLRIRPTGSIPAWEPAKLRILRKLFRKPIVWEVNAPVYEGVILEKYDKLESARREELLKMEAPHVKAAFCVSSELKQYATHVLGVANAIYVPNGSDCEKIGPHVERLSNLGLAESGPILFWMGSGVLPWEGDGIVAELAQEMLDNDIPGTIVMVGNKRDGVKTLPRNIVHLGPIPHVELPKYLATADICLALYDVEAYRRHGYEFYNSPLKLYEYMAAGKAIIGTNVGEIARTIEDQRTGYLVGIHVREIAAAAEELINDKDKRDAMGKAAREKALEFYNWSRVARQTSDALGLILDDT